jgi:hypothetical protein
MMRPEGLFQLKIEPATFRLVAQCLNHLLYRVTIPSWDEYLNVSSDYLEV